MRALTDGDHNHEDTKTRRHEGGHLGSALRTVSFALRCRADCGVGHGASCRHARNPSTPGWGRCAPSTDTSRSRHRRRRRRGRRVPARCAGRCAWPWGCGHGPRARRSTPSCMVRWRATATRWSACSSRACPGTSSREVSTVPPARSGKRPAVLSPHGHWPGGRFQDIAEPERRAELASGAERFDNAARHILQARAVQLARMGAVVFLYDMVGYADSVQIPQEIAHSAARPHARRPRRRAVLQRRRRTAPPLDSRAADLERRPRAGLPQRAARRRSRRASR